jgi:hypothetical protein
MTQSLIKSQNFAAHFTPPFATHFATSLVPRRRPREETEDTYDNPLFMRRKKEIPKYSYDDNDNNDNDNDNNDNDNDNDDDDNDDANDFNDNSNSKEKEKINIMHLQSKRQLWKRELDDNSNELVNTNPFKKYKEEINEEISKEKYIKQVDTIRYELDKLTEKRDRVKKDLEELLEKKRQVKAELEMIDPDLALTVEEKKRIDESVKRQVSMMYM